VSSSPESFPSTPPAPLSLETAWPATNRPPFDLVTVNQLVDACARAAPSEIGPLVVARLTDALGITGAILVAASGERWFHIHPRTTHAAECYAVVTRHAQRFLRMTSEGGHNAWSEGGHNAWVEIEGAAGRRIRMIPLGDNGGTRAVLCLGPKRNGHPYTAWEDAGVRILARYLALRLATTWPTTIAQEALSGRMRQTGDAEVGTTAALTPCEMVVLVYLAAGLSNKDIAAQVGRSVKTIDIHIGHIYEKLQVHSRTQAIHVAHLRHLLSVLPPDDLSLAGRVR